MKSTINIAKSVDAAPDPLIRSLQAVGRFGSRSSISGGSMGRIIHAEARNPMPPYKAERNQNAIFSDIISEAVENKWKTKAPVREDGSVG